MCFLRSYRLYPLSTATQLMLSGYHSHTVITACVNTYAILRPFVCVFSHTSAAIYDGSSSYKFSDIHSLCVFNVVGYWLLVIVFL